jgi:hypothetical protein
MMLWFNVLLMSLREYSVLVMVWETRLRMLLREDWMLMTLSD